jgi:F420H(2)-dependent quinone reductase
MRTLVFSDESLRAMYADGQANATARRFARFWAAVFRLGLLPRRWVTLEVAGRRSGRICRFPLGMADWEGHWYLVSMLGERCNWVRNVRAADGRAVLRRRRAVRCRLIAVPEQERPEILRRYLRKVPGGRPHLPVAPDAPLADFAAIAARYPVFQVVPDRPRRRRWTRDAAALEVAGTIPVAFSAWDIKGPAGYGLLGSLADHGVAEFLITLHRA